MIIALLLSFSVFASPLQLEDIVKSTRSHYPAIIQAKESVTQAEASLRNSEGAFDMKLKGNNFWVTTGYYKRRLNEVRLEKPMRAMGSSVYTSYGKAYPNFFPPQFSTMSTNSGGQAMIGGQISLLRNALLDEPRANVKKNEIGVNKAKQDLEWSKLQVTKEGSLTFWNWVAQSRIYYIYNELLEMAVKRDEILGHRVRGGDISEIVRKENLQYLSRRKAELASAEMELKKISLDLSLYLRDENGNVIMPASLTSEQAISGFINEEERVKKEITAFDSNNLAERIVEFRPDFKKLKLDLDQNEIEYRMGKNDLLPKFDLYTDYTRYIGNDDPTNASHIMEFGLRLEIPLEYELGLGRKQAAGAQRRVLSSQLNYMKDAINNELTKYVQILKLSQDKVVNTRNEVKFAKDLLDAEYIRFKNGNSNLFLVNLREENLVSAEENETHALTELLQLYSEFKAATLQL